MDYTHDTFLIPTHITKGVEITAYELNTTLYKTYK